MDWRELYRRLWHSDLHLPPWEVDRLTMAELHLALDGDLSKSRLPPGARPLRSQAEAEALARAFREMTPRQRLEYARSR